MMKIMMKISKTMATAMTILMALTMTTIIRIEMTVQETMIHCDVFLNSWCYCWGSQHPESRSNGNVPMQVYVYPYFGINAQNLAGLSENFKKLVINTK